jgi:hypothetical protein
MLVTEGKMMIPLEVYTMDIHGHPPFKMIIPHWVSGCTIDIATSYPRRGHSGHGDAPWVRAPKKGDIGISWFPWGFEDFFC